MKEFVCPKCNGGWWGSNRDGLYCDTCYFKFKKNEVETYFTGDGKSVCENCGHVNETPITLSGDE